MAQTGRRSLATLRKRKDRTRAAVQRGGFPNGLYRQQE
jgi:hypothetical protein